MQEFLKKYLPNHGDNKAVCELAGVHSNYLSSYKTGRRQPNLLTFIFICRGIAKYTGIPYRTLVMDALHMIEFPNKKDKH